MSHNQNINQHADYLLYLWFGMMVFTIVISATFQYDLASTNIQKIVGVGLGILFPLITSALLTSSIHLFSSRFHFWGLGALVIFIAAFIWEGHSHYSFWANAMETKAENSSFNRAQTEQLKTLDERLSNLPVVGALFSDSIDKKIAAAEEALAKCPQGHASVCINPNQERLQRLLSEKDRQGAKAQVHQERDMILKQKQEALKAVSGGDIGTENLKAMPVFKDVSVFFYGDFSHAKQFEATAYFAFSLLCTVIASGLLGIRAKLLSREHSPALREQQQTENTYADESRLWNQVQNAAPVYKQKAVNAVGGIRERLQQAMSKPITAQANNATVVGNSVPMELINAVNAQNDMRRGTATTLDDMTTPAATTPPRKMDGIGFNAKLLESCANASETTATTPILNRPAVVECSQLTTPIVVNQLQQATTPANNGNLSGRSAASLVSYDDIKQAVVDGKIPVVSIRKLIDYTKSISQTGTGIGDRTARKIISMLKDDGVVNAKNEVL